MNHNDQMNKTHETSARPEAPHDDATQIKSTTQSTASHNNGAATTEGTIDKNPAPSGAPEILRVAGAPAGHQPQPDPAPVDPFDPMNLGISTDYAAAISAHASTKPFELRKPNNQEFFRTSPFEHQRLLVGGIVDKQDMSKLYVVLPSLLDEVRVRYSSHLRIYELVITQTLAGAPLLWGVPQEEDRGGRWHSQERAARHQGTTRWTNMVAGRGQYDFTTIDNLKQVDWDSFPPMAETLRQALSDGRIIDSMDHPLLRKLRGEIE
jgi:hypothetical protein